MAQVTATKSTTIAAAPEAVLAAVADYTRRAEILPPNYRDFRVVEGGHGAGTVAEWVLQATEKRSRNVRATVTVSGDSVTETDANSSMVTVYSVTGAGEQSTVTITTTWQGAGGIGGFFEKTFAPKGLGRIYDELLTNLKVQVESNG
ncbi:SRPBCC family protein [Tsukamurella pseudospumae]|uniref:Polyketide cyclase n=1 Tax=Tsukamurella pseudospumae TaxID=239498 RepID=A0A138AIU8_9ACTN|nr:SRPBCC family protein [Tsukamurella pseudospumae]KXP00124.1 polyketide cyclase [Tsukamurella pseudospumae]KXP10383.1 polyketide cyclase [Tsukamurella pseudospumae]